MIVPEVYLISTSPKNSFITAKGQKEKEGLHPFAYGTGSHGSLGAMGTDRAALSKQTTWLVDFQAKLDQDMASTTDSLKSLQ